MAEAHGQRQAAAKSAWSRRALLVSATLLLAGCQVIPKAPPREAPPPPVTPAPGPSPLPVDTERHRIALLVPLTGPNAGVGTSIANAATMAVMDTGGKLIRVTTYDTSGGAVAAAQKALAEGNRLILGPLLADDARAVAPVARAAGVPVITFSNDIGVAGDGTYIMGHTSAGPIARVVDYVRAKGITRFAGLVPTGLYGQRAANAYLKSVQAAGGQMVAMQAFDRSAASVRAAAGKMAGTGYQAMLIADSAKTAVLVAPIVRNNGGSKAMILGTELWNTDGASATNPAIRGALFASVSDGLYNQLATKYRARYGKSPYRLASLGYDAVLLVTNIASDWRIGSPFPTAKLSQSSGYTGIDGAFRFNKEGISERALEVQEAGPNGYTVVSPAPRGF